MNSRTSRRTFVAVAGTAMTALASRLGLAFGRQTDAGAEAGRLAAEGNAGDASPGPKATTIYTYDESARIVSIVEPCSPLVTTFVYNDS